MFARISLLLAAVLAVGSLSPVITAHAQDKTDSATDKPADQPSINQR